MATPVPWGLWRQQGSERPRLARRVSLTALSLNCLHVAIVPHLLFDPCPRALSLFAPGSWLCSYGDTPRPRPRPAVF